MVPTVPTVMVHYIPGTYLPGNGTVHQYPNAIILIFVSYRKISFQTKNQIRKIWVDSASVSDPHTFYTDPDAWIF